MKNMNDYDQRQYLRMIELVEAFKKRIIGIDRFLADIDSLLCLLQEPDLDWRKKLRAEWAKIEEIYAVALSKDQIQFSPEDQEYVDQAIEKMEQYLRQIEV